MLILTVLCNFHFPATSLQNKYTLIDGGMKGLGAFQRSMLVPIFQETDSILGFVYFFIDSHCVKEFVFYTLTPIFIYCSTLTYINTPSDASCLAGIRILVRKTRRMKLSPIFLSRPRFVQNCDKEHETETHKQ